MPYLTKRFVVYFDQGTSFNRSVHEMDEHEFFQLTPGQPIYPKGVKTVWESYKPVYSPLFVGNETNLVDDVGQYGSIYLFLDQGFILNKVNVEPKDVKIDISFFRYSVPEKNPDKILYSFYNATEHDIVSIYATVIKDDGSLLGKLKSNPDDVEYRMYLLKRSLSLSPKIGIPKENKVFPENMTAAHVADYLQVKIKTIRNWTSEGKIPVLKLPTGAVRYKLSVIEKWMVDKGQK